MVIDFGVDGGKAIGTASVGELFVRQSPDVIATNPRCAANRVRRDDKSTVPNPHSWGVSELAKNGRNLGARRLP